MLFGSCCLSLSVFVFVMGYVVLLCLCWFSSRFCVSVLFSRISVFVMVGCLGCILVNCF